MGGVNTLVEHLFRHEAGRITASLTRAMGARYLELAEEATQEALIRAIQRWPFGGVPRDPAAWLHTVARNYARDQLRRSSTWQILEPTVRHFCEGQGAPVAPAMDDTLAMMLLCCHPALPPESRVALTLKAVSGFSTREIAAAFLIAEETISQRLVRAKRVLREQRIEMTIPEGEELAGRLGSVCEVLYLLFNEGYFASQGVVALRRDLCEEAVRLLSCVIGAGHATPERWALAGLFHLHLARFDARQDATGQLRDFAEIQNAVYDREHLRRADAALQEAMRTEAMGAWHIEAAIAGAHCAAERDWAHIVTMYDALLQLKPAALIRLNRAVAVFRAGRREEALAELDALEKEKSLRGSSLLPTTQARLHQEAGNQEQAKRAYQRALACTMPAPAREFLQRRPVAGTD